MSRCRDFTWWGKWLIIEGMYIHLNVRLFGFDQLRKSDNQKVLVMYKQCDRSAYKYILSSLSLSCYGQHPFISLMMLLFKSHDMQMW